MSDGPKHSVSVAAVIVNGDREILLVQRADSSEWHIPGGILEVDEDIHAGLCREVREETGLRIEPERLTGIYKNMTLGVVALVFRCRPLDGVLAATTNETRDCAWTTASDAGARMTEAFAIRVLDALRPPGPVAVRIHDGRRLIQPQSG